MKTPVIIGIAGGTGSGKTTVARAIYDRVGSDRIEWISHDSYYRDFDGLPAEERAKINFDHPDSLESELLTRHLDVLSKGSSVEVPVYDFATHSRKIETQRVEPRKVIIVGRPERSSANLSSIARRRSLFCNSAASRAKIAP